MRRGVVVVVVLEPGSHHLLVLFMLGGVITLLQVLNIPTQHSSRIEGLMGTHFVTLCSEKKRVRALLK